MSNNNIYNYMNKPRALYTRTKLIQIKYSSYGIDPNWTRQGTIIDVPERVSSLPYIMIGNSQPPRYDDIYPRRATKFQYVQQLLEVKLAHRNGTVYNIGNKIMYIKPRRFIIERDNNKFLMKKMGFQGNLCVYSYIYL